MKEITKAWLLEVLKTTFDAPIDVVSLVKDDEQPTGYLSNVYFSSITYGPNKQTQELFIKASCDNPELRSYVLDNSLDKLELTFYRDILPLLTNFEADRTGEPSQLQNFIPKFFAGSYGEDSFLILENLAKRGFKLVDCNQGLELDTAKVMMERVKIIQSIKLFSRYKHFSWLSFMQFLEFIFKPRENRIQAGVGGLSIQN